MELIPYYHIVVKLLDRFELLKSILIYLNQVTQVHLHDLSCTQKYKLVVRLIKPIELPLVFSLVGSLNPEEDSFKGVPTCVKQEVLMEQDLVHLRELVLFLTRNSLI